MPTDDPDVPQTPDPSEATSPLAAKPPVNPGAEPGAQSAGAQSAGSKPFTPPDDAELDALEDEFAWDDDPAPPRGVTMRNPILLVAVLVGSIFMIFKYWPRVDYMIAARTPADCGKIHERPHMKAAGETPPPLTHDTYCTAQGLVQNFTILATGEAQAHTDPARRNEGRKYYVKLDGAKVFTVLAADRDDVVKHRARRGSLLGFEVKEPGRMIDPDVDPLYKETGRKLRLHFSVPEGEPVRIFDTTDTPNDRWPAAVGIIFLGLTALLALFGLIRIGRSYAASRDAA